MDPAVAAPDLEETSPPRRSEPHLNPPAPYSCEPTSCRSFLSQCSLTFSLQPSCFPTDESKVALVIMHLAGSAREWGTAMWDNKHECCSSYTNFSQELRKVFDRSALGNEAARAPSLQRQGTRTVSDYAIEFRTLVTSSGWNSMALWDHFLYGLISRPGNGGIGLPTGCVSTAGRRALWLPTVLTRGSLFLERSRAR